jgi:hypothetical protein
VARIATDRCPTPQAPGLAAANACWHPCGSSLPPQLLLQLAGAPVGVHHKRTSNAARQQQRHPCIYWRSMMAPGSSRHMLVACRMPLRMRMHGCPGPEEQWGTGVIGQAGGPAQQCCHDRGAYLSLRRSLYAHRMDCWCKTTYLCTVVSQLLSTCSLLTQLAHGPSISTSSKRMTSARHLPCRAGMGLVGLPRRLSVLCPPATCLISLPPLTGCPPSVGGHVHSAAVTHAPRMQCMMQNAMCAGACPW